MDNVAGNNGVVNGMNYHWRHRTAQRLHVGEGTGDAYRSTKNETDRSTETALSDAVTVAH